MTAGGKQSNEKPLKKVSAKKELPKQNKPYVAMGQYIPVHKNIEKNNQKITSHTNPISNSQPKFCISDADYFCVNSSVENNNSNKLGKNVLNFWKTIFVNLPVINFVYLKIKQAEIKKSIVTLHAINEDVDNYVKNFEGKSVLNEDKYRKICAELKKASDVKQQLENDIYIKH
jgi:hypothetical protein